MAHSLQSSNHNIPGALNSEERLALENLDMGDGLSDSSSLNTLRVTGPKKTHFRKCGKLPDAPKNRDAMGNYIPPFGEGPLSSFGAESTPGANHYHPDFTINQKVYPKYTFGIIPTLQKKHEQRVPGPKYNIPSDIKWGKCRKFTLKGRIPTRTATLGPGPTSAEPKFKPTGPKHSIAKRYKKPYVLNSSLAMPLNPDSPGPKYERNVSWFDKPVTIGMGHQLTKSPPGPGPGKYDVGPEKEGPKYSMTGLPIKKKCDTPGPGPGRYRLRGTIGKGGFKAPLGIRPVEPNYKAYIPGPDIYHRAGFRLDEPGVTMKYRWMDGPPAKIPGPASYNLNDSKADKGPSFTIKSKAKDIIKQGPGPGEYDVKIAACKGKPGKTFGLRWKHPDFKSNTATADYVDPETSMKTLPKAPVFSFGSKNVLKSKKNVLPGPGHYQPQQPPSKKTISFGRPHLAKKPEVGPGPAMPISLTQIIHPCPPIDGRAPTLKSRHSPLKYSGMKDSAVLRIISRDGECVPLLG